MTNVLKTTPQTELEDLAYANCHGGHLAEQIALVCAGLKIKQIISGLERVLLHIINYCGPNVSYQ